MIIAEQNLETQSVYLDLQNPIIIDLKGERIDVAELEEIRVAIANGYDETGVLEKYSDGPQETFLQEDIDDYQEEIDAYIQEEHDVSREAADEWMIEDATREILFENGIEPEIEAFDGIIGKNMIDDIGEASRVVADPYIAFEPNQIKSANNKGIVQQNRRQNIIRQSAQRPRAASLSVGSVTVRLLMIVVSRLWFIMGRVR